MSLKENFFQPIDNSQLVLFRILYGFFLMIEAWGAIATGWVHKAFIEPSYNFPFIDFSFLQPLGGNGMIYYYIIMGLFGLMVMIGWKYRVAIIGYTLMWAGVYFMQKTSYNNHYYLMVLFNFIFCFMPANRYAAIDCKVKPEFKRIYCPQWCIWWFKAMIVTVYFYSAVAKMYPGWLAAEPIKIWFAAKSQYPVIGPLLSQEWFQYFVAWGGITFDLLIGPALLWKKTRKYAFFASLFFHLFNSVVFHIGVFPFLGISFGVLFFEAEKIRSLFFQKKAQFNRSEFTGLIKKNNLFLGFVATFLIIQVLLPLRHWYFKGDVNWTEEGHRLSWHMMLRVKGGNVRLYVEDKKSKMRESVRIDEYLTPKQQRSIATRPDMFWQFIQYLKKDLDKQGKEDYAIYVISNVSLNGAPAKPLYDFKYDLTEAKWNRFSENEWVLRD